MSLREEIEELAANDDPTLAPRARALFEELKAALNRGEVRAADRCADGTWRANAWVKRGILLGFRLGTLTDMSPADHSLRFFDKNTYPLRALAPEHNVRIVPGDPTSSPK